MDKIALILVIVGALNWLLVGLFGFDLVGWIFGGQLALMSRIIFIIVGLAGLWSIKFLTEENVQFNKDDGKCRILLEGYVAFFDKKWKFTIKRRKC